MPYAGKAFRPPGIKAMLELFCLVDDFRMPCGHSSLLSHLTCYFAPNICSSLLILACCGSDPQWRFTHVPLGEYRDSVTVQ